MALTIGFIGLGVMGRPMALNLRKAGFPVVVHSRSRAPVEALVDAGARVGGTPRGVAEESDVVITMLPDTPDVEKVIEGPDGVLEGLRPGAVVIDMSSISPDATRRLAARIAERGGAMIDAPVSGGEIGAKTGTLSIMAGGDEQAFERARPVLAAMGAPERIVRIGPSGAGQVCKICNQMAIGGALAGVSEAFAIARAAGIDAALVRQALLGGFAASRVLEVHGERLLTGNFVPGFRTALYQKDLRLAAETARDLNVRTRATDVVSSLVDALADAGSGHLDYAAIGTMVPGVPVVACGEVAAIDVTSVTLDDARRAFAWAQPTLMRQAWLQQRGRASFSEEITPGPIFQPAVVRTAWHGQYLYVLADLTDTDVTNTATGHGQRFWELGDTFEMFLRRDGLGSYIECHVTPNNHRLQLRFPASGPSATSFEAALIPGDGFESRTWQREDGRGWSVLAAIPASLAGAVDSPLAGSTWRFSFSRYDYTRGADTPVISSTSRHAAPSFHRQHEWGLLRCAQHPAG
ncbi:MAG TPA: NAD(P)-binding domain-containing protein [Vicinamibacterales bacterium]|nr:NAD(P)-binding domain-containing protein [Vicinamibacterales bacterium]